MDTVRINAESVLQDRWRHGYDSRNEVTGKWSPWQSEEEEEYCLELGNKINFKAAATNFTVYLEVWNFLVFVCPKLGMHITFGTYVMGLLSVWSEATSACVCPCKNESYQFVVRLLRYDGVIGNALKVILCGE